MFSWNYNLDFGHMAAILKEAGHRPPVVTTL